MNIFHQRIENAMSIAVLGHSNPDGDCVGSCLAVYHYILNQYPDKKVFVALDYKPACFSLLPGFDEIITSGFAQYEVDLCIIVDCSEPSRFKDRILIFEQSGEKMCIDHHKSHHPASDYTILDASIGSTCELLYDQMNTKYIDNKVAQCLYTGIVHDTGCFRFPATTSKTLRIAADLMDRGIDFSRILEESYYSKTYAQNQVMGRALSESILFLNKQCIFSYMSKALMEFYGVTQEDLSGIINTLRDTSGVDVAIFFYEISPQSYKVSLRSKYKVDVSTIAEYFGGGGHVHAAGCILHGTRFDVVNNLSRQIELQLMQQDVT